MVRLVSLFGGLELRGYNAFNEGQNPISLWDGGWPINTDGSVIFRTMRGFFMPSGQATPFEASLIPSMDNAGLRRSETA